MKRASYLIPATGRSRFLVLILSIIFGMCVAVIGLNAILIFFPSSRLSAYLAALPIEISWMGSPTGSIAVSAIDGESTATVDTVAGDLPEAADVATPKQSLPSNLQQILPAIFDVLPSPPGEREQSNSEAKVNLGRLLFFDPSLSSNGTVSCNHCHNLQNYGVDGLAQSLGVTGISTSRNTPTVYNAALQKAQFWDGRSPSVEDQAVIPILAEHEMGMVNAERVVARLQSIAAYPVLFQLAFPNDPNPISLKNVGIALGAFERGLITPSRFDKFLTGDYAQLNEQEIRGLDAFIALRCITCHNGAGIGGANFTPLGITEPYPTRDIGRFATTNREEDKFVFKVSSLRNVAQTAPYLHDGSIATLEEVVRLMARYQLGKSVTDQQVEDMVAFLQTLTGEIPDDYIATPELP